MSVVKAIGFGAILAQLGVSDGVVDSDLWRVLGAIEACGYLYLVNS